MVVYLPNLNILAFKTIQIRSKSAKCSVNIQVSITLGEVKELRSINKRSHSLKTTKHSGINLKGEVYTLYFKITFTRRYMLKTATTNSNLGYAIACFKQFFLTVISGAVVY